MDARRPRWFKLLRRAVFRASHQSMRGGPEQGVQRGLYAVAAVFFFNSLHSRTRRCAESG